MAAVAGTLGICCGIPVLATLGLLGVVTGLSLTSWTLICLGAGAAALGGWRLLRREHGADSDSSDCPPRRAHQQVTRTPPQTPTLPQES